MPKLEAAGIPYAPIVRPDQLVDDPHLIESGGLVDMPTDDGGSTEVVLLPLLMGGRRPGVRHALPKIGEHTEEDPGAPRAALIACPDPHPIRSPTSNRRQHDLFDLTAAPSLALAAAALLAATGVACPEQRPDARDPAGRRRLRRRHHHARRAARRSPRRSAASRS